MQVYPLKTRVKINGIDATITAIHIYCNEPKYTLEWWDGRDKKENTFYSWQFEVPTTTQRQSIGFVT